MSSAAMAAPPANAQEDPFTNFRFFHWETALTKGWEYYRGQLGLWEVWRGDKASDNVAWEKVNMPHCFNARDAVDPDQPYYQGPGWYRTYVDITNPDPGGRTLLRFEGAGQKTWVYVGQQLVAKHVGGYDEWTVDITEAAGKLKKVPVAICCDNSRDLEMIPSNLSDFNLYGGLYRNVNLRSVPAVSLDRLRIDAGAVRVRLYNPLGLKDAVELSVQISDPKGKVIHQDSRKVTPWTGEKEIAQFKIDSPMLWSPDRPSLYSCLVTVNWQGESERFGIRSGSITAHLS
jgi:beta-galactosidase